MFAALYVSEDFKSFKFYLTKLVSGKEPSYSFSISVLKSTTQFGNLARVKINSLKFNDFGSMHDIVKTNSEQAIRNFEENLGGVIKLLRKEIVNKLDKDHALKKDVKESLVIFSRFIGPEFDYNALIELLIQHLLTKDIFAAAYGKTFQHGNAVANSLENLAQRFSDIPTLVNDEHELRERRDSIIQVIELNSTEKRLEIIKLVYEAFYSVYNPLDADRLGIVYTPKIAVDFIIRSTDKLMSKHLQANISDKNIHVMDPCIGTGTFMISLLNYLSQEAEVNDKSLNLKYTNELHANEVSILAYYIAAMNVERTIESITGKAKSFHGMVWRDTLLKVNLDDFPFEGNDNMSRMKAQQKHKITVVLGNPPYNVGQKNFGDGNPNPTYYSTNHGIDDRITETYHKKSQFKKQTRDMYKRFVRWASDQIGEYGIISFISNNSFVHSNNYDGMRACLAEEFDFIYVCDLRGNANTRGKKRKKEADGLFGEKSKVGIAIYFLIKTKKKQKNNCKIYYADVGDYKTQQQKFEWIENKTIDNLSFKHIVPSIDNNWIGKPNDMDYRKMIPLISFKSKQGKCEDAIFQLFTNGVKTNADSWQVDFCQKNLLKKLKIYSKEYNRIRNLYNSQSGSKQIDIMSFISQSSIPWYGELDEKAKKNKPMTITASQIRAILYRPYLSKYFHYDKICAQRLYRWPDIVSQKQTSDTNPAICVSSRSSSPLECLGGYDFFDHSVVLNSQIIPLYRLNTDGKLITNLTNYGHKLFCTHYQNSNISDMDIFYYCYAVLNDPIYIKKYEHEIRTLHPHIPTHPKFYEWSSVGKILFKLHANFRQQPKYQLHEISEGGDKSKFILNLTSSTSGTWKARIDESLSIDKIPVEAADPKAGGYVIGARTPIGWALEYYQKACRPSRSKVPKKLDLLNFLSHRDEIIDVVYRLCTVSIETIKIKDKISKLPHSFDPCKKSCCNASSTKTSSPRNSASKKCTKHDTEQKKL